jgi:hypothetical protein
VEAAAVDPEQLDPAAQQEALNSHEETAEPASPDENPAAS